jgi:hypothetical protein
MRTTDELDPISLPKSRPPRAAVLKVGSHGGRVELDFPESAPLEGVAARRGLVRLLEASFLMIMLVRADVIRDLLTPDSPLTNALLATIQRANTRRNV